MYIGAVAVLPTYVVRGRARIVGFSPQFVWQITRGEQKRQAGAARGKVSGSRGAIEMLTGGCQFAAMAFGVLCMFFVA